MSEPAQQTQDKGSSSEHCTGSEEKPSCSQLESSTHCISEEKDMVEPEERPSHSKLDGDMPNENKPKRKSHEKTMKTISSPLDLLKWRNKKSATETKKGRKKE